MMINNEILMSGYQYDTFESAIIHYICLNVRAIKSNKYIRIYLSELEHLAGTKLNYTRCYNILKEIEAKNLFSIEKDGLKHEFPLLAKIVTPLTESSEKDVNKGEIAILLSQDAFNLLKKQENYTNVQTGSIVRLSTPTAKRLYALLLHYYDIAAKNGSGGYYKVIVEDLKEDLGMGDKYTAYSMFANFIQKQIDEINERTEITAVIKPIKRGKKVTWWNIHTQKNAKIEEKINHFYHAMIANEEVNEKIKAMKENIPSNSNSTQRYQPIAKEMAQFVHLLNQVPRMNITISAKIIAHVDLYGFESFIHFAKWIRILTEIAEGKSTFKNPAGYVKTSFLGKN